jgi:hypothetical protein
MASAFRMNVAVPRPRRLHGDPEAERGPKVVREAGSPSDAVLFGYAISILTIQLISLDLLPELNIGLEEEASLLIGSARISVFPECAARF